MDILADTPCDIWVYIIDYLGEPQVYNNLISTCWFFHLLGRKIYRKMKWKFTTFTGIIGEMGISIQKQIPYQRRHKICVVKNFKEITVKDEEDLEYIWRYNDRMISKYIVKDDKKDGYYRKWRDNGTLACGICYHNGIKGITVKTELGYKNSGKNDDARKQRVWSSLKLIYGNTDAFK